MNRKRVAADLRAIAFDLRNLSPLPKADLVARLEELAALVEPPVGEPPAAAPRKPVPRSPFRTRSIETTGRGSRRVAVEVRGGRRPGLRS